MISLPTLSGYDLEASHNSQKLEEFFNQLFPDLFIPADYIYELLSFLQESKINITILPEVVRGVSNLLTGTGEGQCIVHVHQGMCNVQVREQCRERPARFNSCAS